MVGVVTVDLVDLVLQSERRQTDGSLMIVSKPMSADAAIFCKNSIIQSDLADPKDMQIRIIPADGRQAVEITFKREEDYPIFKWALTKRGPLDVYRDYFFKRTGDILSSSEEK